MRAETADKVAWVLGSLALVLFVAALYVVAHFVVKFW